MWDCKPQLRQQLQSLQLQPLSPVSGSYRTLACAGWGVSFALQPPQDVCADNASSCGGLALDTAGPAEVLHVEEWPVGSPLPFQQS
jgi:hypothetical protein